MTVITKNVCLKYEKIELPFNINLIVSKLVSSAPLTTATIWAELGPAQLQLFLLYYYSDLEFFDLQGERTGFWLGGLRVGSFTI